MKKIIGLFCCITSYSVCAQEFKGQAQIDSVNETGFHNILLTPEINSHLNAHFSDIRLYDDKNGEVPYLQRSESPTIDVHLFKEYTIISKEMIKGNSTRVILSNPEKTKINNISLVIKNADVQKKVRLSGSDDQENWYVVKDKSMFYSVISNSETAEIKLLDFPLSNYLFYKIEINDSSSAPLNILKAGFYDTYSESGKYTEVKGLHMYQSDSAKKTIVKFLFDSPQYMDKLDLEIDGPIYYLRRASICELKRDSVKKREVHSYFQTIEEAELASNHPNSIRFSNYKAKEFYLVIENEDNRPLHIRAANVVQLNHYLTAYLEKGKHYVLKFGDPKMGSSSYDINYFNDSIPKKVPLLLPGQVTIKQQEEAKPQASLFSNKTVLWVVIGLVIGMLGILSLKMIKEIK